MAVAPASSTGKVLDNLRTALANSTTFQAWVGAADAAAALASIHLYDVDPDADKSFQAQMPLAIVRDADPPQVAWTHLSAWPLGGVVVVEFLDAVAAANQSDHEAAGNAFRNNAEGVLDDLMALSEAGGYLMIRRIEPESGPARTHPDYIQSQGDAFMATYRVHWGLEESVSA